MPRVTIKKKEYMISDLSQWIAGRMYAKKLRQQDMAETIGITQSAFCQRMKKVYSLMERCSPYLRSWKRRMKRFCGS